MQVTTVSLLLRSRLNFESQRWNFPSCMQGHHVSFQKHKHLLYLCVHPVPNVYKYFQCWRLLFLFSVCFHVFSRIVLYLLFKRLNTVHILYVIWPSNFHFLYTYCSVRQFFIWHMTIFLVILAWIRHVKWKQELNICKKLNIPEEIKDAYIYLLFCFYKFYHAKTVLN